MRSQKARTDAHIYLDITGEIKGSIQVIKAIQHNVRFNMSGIEEGHAETKKGESELDYSALWVLRDDFGV